jgi:molybdate transport system substrate-binding protein
LIEKDLRPVIRLAFGLLLGVALHQAAHAAEVKVLTAGVMKDVVLTLKPQFEKQTGHRLVVDVAPAGMLASRIETGEAFDLAIITRPVIDSLIENGKVARNSRTDLAGVGIGVVVKEGAAVPDISSVDAFRRTLLAATSVAHTDPAAGATSGIYLAQLFEKLGIADQVKAKVTLVRGGSSAPLVASGKVEIAVQQISEILNVPGTRYVGPLPPAIQNVTIYSAGINTEAREGNAATEFVGLLTGPEAIRLLKPHGLEPIGTHKK